MAKEAIEVVKKAEKVAENIISKAENEAINIIKEAKDRGIKEVSDFKTECADKMKSSVNNALKKNAEELEEYKSEVLNQCEDRHKEIMLNKDIIINKIIDVVKKG